MADPQYIKHPTTPDGADNSRPHQYRWTGEGPEPASWYADDGTKVYRSYADYCDD